MHTGVILNVIPGKSTIQVQFF